MAYQALYRQWRPKDFSSMVAQEAVIATLRNQVMSGRIAHAYLFCGSRGTGKTSTAKIMSRAINCEHPRQGDPCGECPTCRLLMQDESLDVTEIDAASNNGVDEIRDLRETVKYPPQNAKYKVYIIDEVHMLSASAFNALLKTLEEPPAHAVFILATTEPQKLPATILSRCQRYDFGRIPAAQIAGRLREAVEGEQATADDRALNMIARAAEGGMRDALSILDMCLGYQHDVTEELVRRVLGTSDRSFLFRFAECLQNEDAASLLAMIDEMMRTGRDPVVFAKDVSQHLRALMIAQCCPDDLPSLLDVTSEDAEAYQGQAEGFTPTRLMSMIDLFMAVETELRYASSPRIALEAAALRACLRTGENDTAAMVERIAELEKQVARLTEQLKSGVRVPTQPEPKPVKEKPQEAPKPAKPAVLTPTGGSAEDAWKEALNWLKRNDASIYGMLSQGRFAGAQDNCYRWEAPGGMDFFVTAMNVPAKREAVAAAITQAAGVESIFEAVLPGVQRSQSEEKSEQSLLGALANTFGPENLSVQEEGQ
ncbi:MAG: DNA polymerase III subunit gamma/tau [bacterium]|nr:DNA polymerase III subunit gamma/tau [bacterium]